MDQDFDSNVQKQLDAAMPWVGLYIAAASAICTLAMATDAVTGFRHKKLWFPCKYSSLNAASLTVLAVAMKLPMDLNTVMIKSETDAAAKFTSLTFISVIMMNFMPSLGSMNDKELLANVTGLCILVITIFGNVGIQFLKLRRFLKPDAVNVFFMAPSVIMLLQLLPLISQVVSASAMKRNLKLIYQEKQRAVLEESVLDEKRQHLMKYWVMAESCSPQFVMARSVVCTAAAMMCWISNVAVVFVNRIRGTNTNRPGESAYGNYTKRIVDIQSIGIAIGVVVAMFRWFIVVVLRCSTIDSSIFKIEDYWVQALRDWRNSFAGSQIRPNLCRKYLHDLKWCVLTLCIGIQMCIVLLSKLLVFISVFILRPFLPCFTHIVNQLRDIDHDSDADLNLSRYVLLLEGEAELPLRFVRRMRGEADSTIETGRRKKPSSLLELLYKSAISNRSGQFNNNADCWTMSFVSLTSIAIALPNTALHQRRQLLTAVGEGLSLAKIVEKSLDTSSQLKNMRVAARITWAEVRFYSKWLGMDLQRATLTCKSSNEVLKKLLDKAEEIVMEFKRQVQDPTMENHINWPVNVVAANSMYGICQSILESSVGEDEEMFERISVMIGDNLSDCLIKLPHAITKMCHQNWIEKRERSVREAFLLLGKTEQVIELLLQQSPDQFRAFLQM